MLAQIFEFGFSAVSGSSTHPAAKLGEILNVMVVFCRMQPLGPKHGVLGKREVMFEDLDFPTVCSHPCLVTCDTKLLRQTPPSPHCLATAAYALVSPYTNMYLCYSFQIKFKHLWDASERSVRSAAASVAALEAEKVDVPPGPLEQALSTRGSNMPRLTHSGSTDAARTGRLPQQGSTALGLTGRLSSLFSRRSGVDGHSQRDDDFSGSNYTNRDY